ncbi:MAG: YdbH domain-containing protein, partial [Sphingobium sp.]
SYGSLRPHVSAVRAHGVRLYGKIRDGRLMLGELDKFRDPTSTSPFSLPDMDLALDDARMRIDTPAGAIGASVNGSGNLTSGFTGKVAAIMRNAHAAGCASPLITSYLDARIMSGKPHLAGPVRADALGCPASGIALAQPSAQLDIGLSEQLDRWSGRVQIGAEALRARSVAMGNPRADVHFDGSAGQTKGRVAMNAAALKYAAAQTGAMNATGTWSFAQSTAGFRGQVDAHNIRPRDATAFAHLRNAGAGTPVAPLVQRLIDAAEAAGRDNKLRSFVHIAQASGKGRITLSGLDFASNSGAHIALSKDGSFAYGWPTGQWAMLGSLTSNGGGLPGAALRLTSAAGGGVSGQMFVDPYASGKARLALDPVRFVAASGGRTHITTGVRLDGPLGDGGVRGLTLPIDAEMRAGGAMIVNARCTPVRFDSLQFGSLRLGRHTLGLCPQNGAALLTTGPHGVQGGALIRALKLNGTLGNSPMQLTAQDAQYALHNGQFGLANAKLVLGHSDAPVKLSATRLSGASLAGGLGGTAQGVEAQIGSVPTLVRDGTAHWGYAGGALRMSGSIGIIDAATPDRFNPLQARDFTLTLANGHINAAGTLTLPQGNAPIAKVRITHELASGTGTADLTIDGIHFGPNLQPDQVSRLALGVIANAAGTVTGNGHIAWNPQRVTSTGQFATQDMNFAAAFGPVTGFATHINFTDLIGLVTAPGQVATFKTVNPGVEVFDGSLHYQLLPDQRIAVESGHWPFSGGDLTLLPGVMDFGADRPRNLTFRVLGLDAGAFINTLELDNISATGTFDGLLPMVFDANGGRIVGGVLVARQVGMPPLVIDQVNNLHIPCDPSRKGGTLSYVGQVSNENLGRMGRLAFDALKDLQYKCLTILMDGAIDGEVVTQVAFNGVNRGELTSVPKLISRQFMGLPFIFNVRIEAPFRGLINTARSFVDPSLLIRSQLGDQFAPVIQNRLAVQPRESETGVTGDKK